MMPKFPSDYVSKSACCKAGQSLVLGPAVLRIRDILIENRMRILGSVPLTNGSGSYSFRLWPSRGQQKSFS